MSIHFLSPLLLSVQILEYKLHRDAWRQAPPAPPPKRQYGVPQECLAAQG